MFPNPRDWSYVANQPSLPPNHRVISAVASIACVGLPFLWYHWLSPA